MDAEILEPDLWSLGLRVSVHPQPSGACHGVEWFRDWRQLSRYTSTIHEPRINQAEPRASLTANWNLRISFRTRNQAISWTARMARRRYVILSRKGYKSLYLLSDRTSAASNADLMLALSAETSGAPANLTRIVCCPPAPSCARTSPSMRWRTTFPRCIGMVSFQRSPFTHSSIRGRAETAPAPPRLSGTHSATAQEFPDGCSILKAVAGVGVRSLTTHPAKGCRLPLRVLISVPSDARKWADIAAPLLREPRRNAF